MAAFRYQHRYTGPLAGVDDIAAVPDCLDDIKRRLARGECP